MKFETRYGNNPVDSAAYGTGQLRDNYLIDPIFIPDDIKLVYSHHDRIIAGGIMPKERELTLETVPEIAANYFLERREAGVINTGGSGVVTVDGVAYTLSEFDGLYIGKGAKKVSFKSDSCVNPAKFYLNSSPAHTSYPTVHIPLANANKVSLGDDENVNKRTINRYVHPAVCSSCQLAMGMTIFHKGSVWNTMPCHTHERRMEVYFYFNLPPGQVVFHLMGTKDETRHIVVQNEQAVISPSWSIHSGVGTSSYTFIWGMCGENQVFEDMDAIQNTDLK